MRLIHFVKDVPNFGDDLNRELWPILAPDLFAPDEGTGFVGIGTIIGMPVGACRTLHVFSAGAGYNPMQGWRDLDVTYWCVRGPFSARMLDLPEDRAITDGAVLTPLTPGFPAVASEGRGTVVVPHFETMAFSGWEEVARLTGFEMLDPRGSPKHVIGRIATAELVLTESLHGAVLADTYGVPWLAFATTKNLGVSKWIDWTRSVGRDFTVTAVPPPDPGAVLAFGRWDQPDGETTTFGLENAFSRFTTRVEEPAAAVSPVRSSVKRLVRASSWLHPLLGYTPRRTAEALGQLVRREPVVTARSTITTLQDNMQDRLSSLRRSVL